MPCQKCNLVSLLLKLNVILSLYKTKWLFCISFRQFWSLKRNITIFVVCLGFLSRWHWSQGIGKTKVHIKLIETSLFTILNILFPQYFFVNNFPDFNHRINILLFLGFFKRLGCWRMYRTSFQDVLEAENEQNQSPYFFWKCPVGFGTSHQLLLNKFLNRGAVLLEKGVTEKKWKRRKKWWK